MSTDRTSLVNLAPYEPDRSVEATAVSEMRTILFKTGVPLHGVQGEEAHLRLPLANLALAAYLRERGVDVLLHDARVLPVESADFHNVDIVGISCMTGVEVKSGLAIARYVRDNYPDVLIVWGGIHPSLHIEETAAHELVDVVVYGEGEETLYQVILAHRQGEDIVGMPGTCVRSCGEVVKGPERAFLKLDDLPLPAYDMIDMGDYPRALDNFDYQTSRGCPFRCTFCYIDQFTSRRWRARSANRVIYEMKHLESVYGVRHFALVDDELFIDRNRVGELLDEYERVDARFTWMASCRIDMADRLPDSTFDRLKSCGIHRLYFGVESGSEETLKYIRKGITVPQVHKTVERCLKNGIQPVLSFMGGMPHETEEQFAETLDFIEELRREHRGVVINGLFPYSPYPGTPMFDEAKATGMRFPESLDEWGEWKFEYSPDHPWLTERMRKDLEVVFLLVRFRYLRMRYLSQPDLPFWKRWAFECASLPLVLSERVRWKMSWFRCFPEWKCFRFLMQHTFGYL